MARTVLVLSTVSGSGHTGEVSVGVLPSVVQRTIAPAVEVETRTCWAEVNDPGAGLNVGVAAGSGAGAGGGGFGASATFGCAQEFSGVQGIVHGRHTGWNEVGPPADFVVAQPVAAISASTITRLVM